MYRYCISRLRVETNGCLRNIINNLLINNNNIIKIFSHNISSHHRVIDLRSDTLTKPSLEMRKVMANAEVGDDVKGEDPTVKELENYVAKLVGKECALFVPSGTMANLIATMSHCWQRGAEILLGDQSHLHINEQGGIATIANVHSRTLKNKSDGTFCIEELKGKIRPNIDQHFPNSTLICLENTHNICNGSTLPIDFIDEVCRIAKLHKVGVHMDGARLFNASIKSGESPDRIVKNCDSVSFCLSKSLGCPVGSLLAGSEEFINRAIRCRKVLGGGMRQSGVLAAAGLWALKNNVNRLKDDHKHANMIARAIAESEKSFITIDLKKVQTNIAYIDVNPSWMTAEEFASRLQTVSNDEKAMFGDHCAIIKMDAKSESRLRFMTHLDISTEDILSAIEKLKFVIDVEGRDGSFERINV